jgi:hypothetical protein
MTNKEEIKYIDIYEFYSFSIYLYSYGFFYLFIFEQSFIRAIFIAILSNIISTYFINHNIFKLLTHKYWRKNKNDIAIPQLISCLSTVSTYNYNYYITIPSNLLMYFLINKFYKKELSYSKNLRIILFILFSLAKYFF